MKVPANWVGWDIETDRLSPYEAGARILTAAVSDGLGAWGTCFDHPLARSEDRCGVTAGTIDRLLADPKITVVGQNVLAFDIPWWEKNQGREVRGPIFDTRIAAALLDEDAANTLEYLAERYLGEQKNPDGLDRRKLAEADPALVLKYNILDARQSLLVGVELERRLRERGLLRLFGWLMRVGRVLGRMQTEGVEIDQEWVAKQAKALAQESSDHRALLLDVIVKYTGDEEFNVDSAVQLRKFLFEELRLNPIVSTPKGEPSTSTPALKAIREKARGKEAKGLIDSLLDYRKAKKLLTTYLTPLVGKHLGGDGRIHTTYHLGRSYDGGTVTGRLSSSNPNLQNIPRDKRIKGAFVPEAGLRLFEADYSQIELRVAAWFAGEESMLSAFRAGRDVHTATLAELEGVPYKTAVANVKSGVWEENRALIKRVNFGVLYGVGDFRLVQLMRDMGIRISQARATEIIKWWYASKPQMAQWIDDVHERAVEQKQVVTPTGRVRHLPDAGWDQGPGARALRQSVNFMVQSFSADVMLAALLRLNARFEKEGGARLLLTVHDSVVGEYHPDDWGEDELKRILNEEMVEGALDELRGIGMDENTDDLLLEIDTATGLERWGG